MAHSKRPKAVNRKALNIRKDDEVIVISGSGSKDKTPKKVIQVLPKERKVVVEGVNIMKDRQRNKGGQGGNQQEVVEKEFPIPASRVALVDPKTKKPTRVKIQKNAEGKRERVAKSGTVIA